MALWLCFIKSHFLWLPIELALPIVPRATEFLLPIQNPSFSNEQLPLRLQVGLWRIRTSTLTYLVSFRNLSLQKFCSTTPVVKKHVFFFFFLCPPANFSESSTRYLCSWTVQKWRLYPCKSNTCSLRTPCSLQVHSISPCPSAAFQVRVTLAPSSFPGQEEPPQNSQQKLGVRKFYLLLW